MEPRIFGILQRVAAEQDKARVAALKAETTAELAQYFYTHPWELQELAYDVLNKAWADAQPGDLVNTLIDVKTVGLGETDFIEEDLRGMRAYFQGKGGQIRSDIIRMERQMMPREELVSAIDMHVDQVKTDFWGTLSKLKSQAQEKFRTAPAYRLVELIQAAIVGGSTYGSFAASSVDADDLDPILDEVSLRSDGQVTLFGTSTAIRKLANVGLEFGDNLKEQIFRTGVIGQYKGYPLATLEQFEDFEGRHVLPTNEIFLIGRNAGRMTWYGAEAKVQQLPLPSFWFRWETARDVGMSIYGASKGRIGRIVLT
jgi:hypothetical protein